MSTIDRILLLYVIWYWYASWQLTFFLINNSEYTLYNTTNIYPHVYARDVLYILLTGSMQYGTTRYRTFVLSWFEKTENGPIFGVI